MPTRMFRHALALDERRARFIPTYYQESNAIRGADEEEKTKRSPLRFWKKDGSKENSITASTDKGEDGKLPTDVEEVWFAGCHGDVGGGSVANTAQHCLANISLRWMVREVEASGCGIQFDPGKRAQLDVHPDNDDCLEPIHDALSGFTIWKLGEVHKLNLGRGRSIPKTSTAKFHTTVQHRMTNEEPKYTHKARLSSVSTVVYVPECDDEVH